VPLLVADIGNSHTVLGLLEPGAEGAAGPTQGEVTQDWRIATDERRTADEWAVLLRGLLGRRRDDLDGIAALLEAAGIEDRNADARRNQEAAVQSVSETRLLVEKGLKTDRELAKAEYAVTKRATQLELVALDRLAFTYKVKAMVLTL